mgnify:CR=1 FL=1
MREFIEKDIPLTPLVNFWKLTMLNPADHVKRDLYNFMDQYEFPITDSGYFIAYKSVKKTNKTYKAVNMWIPKEYTGTFGNSRDFQLKFLQSGSGQNSSGLGADTSGNDNHFSLHNMGTDHQSLDSPTFGS